MMSRKDELQDVIEKVQNLMRAPSTYAGLKEKAQMYLDSIGTNKEKIAAKSLIEEVEGDITTIDNLVPFAHSAQAVEIFGAEGAKKFAAHADELQAKGVKYCDCPACSAGLSILEDKDLILQA